MLISEVQQPEIVRAIVSRHYPHEVYHAHKLDASYPGWYKFNSFQAAEQYANKLRAEQEAEWDAEEAKINRLVELVDLNVLYRRATQGKASKR
jgi:hypothetical protein